MPNLKKTNLSLRRAFASAFLLSAGLQAAASAELNFWGLSNLTYSESNIEDEDLVNRFLTSLHDGQPIFTDLPLSELSDFTDTWNSNFEEETSLKFGFLNNGTKGPLFIADGSVSEINRQLEWKVLYRPGLLPERNSNALVLSVYETPLSGGPVNLNFNNSVLFEVKNLGSASLPIVLLDSDQQVSFNQDLTVRDLSDIKQTAFLLRADSKLTFKGNSQINTLGTGFSFNDGSLLSVEGDFSVTAGKVFTGQGNVLVSNNASVYLSGDLNDFKGEYRQVGGSLVLNSEIKLRDKHWSFDNVSLTASSSNLFEVSAGDYESTKILQGTIISTDKQPFSEIILTDERVSLEYLNRATHFYKGAVVTYTGELFIDEKIINYITLDNHYGLLDTPNVGLASVRLHLADETVLSGKELKIGSLTNHARHLTLDGSNVVLYAPGPVDFAGKLQFLALTNNSELSLRGLENSREQAVHGLMSSSVYIEDGSRLNLIGWNLVDNKAPIINYGEVKFTSFSRTDSLSDYYQVDGSTAISKGAVYESEKSFEVYGGKVDVEGSLLVSSLTIKNAAFNVEGTLKATELKMGSESTHRTPNTLVVAGSAQATFDDADMLNTSVVVAGNKDSGETASLYIKRLSGSDNHIAVRQAGLLILGDDLSGDGLGYGREESLGILDQFSAVGKAVVVINETQRLGSGNVIVAGAAETKEASASMVFAGDSALLLRGRSGVPAFTATEGGSLLFEEGSSILVVDPYGTNQLTDASILDFEGRDKVELVSLNKNIQLSLVNSKGEGWFIKREEVIAQNFLYPELQGWLYANPEGFTIDSENAAQRFFARADNEVYMNTGQSHALIAESTQLASLLGTRTNFYLQGKESVRSKEAAIGQAILRPDSDIHTYGSVSGRFFVSKDLNGYLGSAAYRASTEDIRIGLAGAAAGWYWATEFGAGIVSSKSRHTITEAKGTQYLFDISGAVARKWGNATLSANLGFGYASNRLKADLPASMQTDQLKGRIKDKFVTLGAKAAYLLTNNIEVSVAPQLWIFPKVDEKTYIGSSRAFNLKTKTQTVADIPLSLKGEWAAGNIKGAKFEIGAEIGGSVKVGALDKKGVLSAVGTGATESISQKEFHRLNGFGSVDVKVRKDRLEGVLSVSAATGDGKVGASVGAKVNWAF